MIAKKNNFIKGIVIVGGLFVALFAFNYFQKTWELKELIETEEKYNDSLPDGFREEVIDPEKLDAQNLKVGIEGKVIGFIVKAYADEVSEVFRNLLKSGNWKETESGNKLETTFTKKDGEYNWLYLSCSPMGKETSVVITLENN